AVFNQNSDKPGKFVRAQWLFGHGADFSNPGAQQALTYAVFENEVDAVRYLLAKGASPNGANSNDALNRCATATIQLASSHCGETPFYTALQQSILLYATDSPAAAAHAEEQH